ncbi:MAG: energy-coupling factor ABC transporter ATP-binding protein [Candidatus Kryptonium sp.]|nr:energy-coupling factor ABC transporter ATP-binding protein [Candidatus Kryptonium sp.]
MSTIRVEDLWFYYKPENYILENINITFDSSSTAIIGQNGAGKTTFVKILKGLLKPVKGNVWIKEYNTKEVTVAKLAKIIGLVFQNPSDQIFKNKVLEEVMFGPINVFKDKQHAYQKSIEALKLVGLDKKLDQHPYDLTLSERKLLCIASILAMEPEIVIFDEPTIAQDRYSIKRISDIIKELKRQGKLVLTITHDMDFAYENFEKTVIFYKGKIISYGSTKTILSDHEKISLARLEQPFLLKLQRLIGKEL